MPLNLPDPAVVARQEAEWIVANRVVCFDAPMDRVIADAPQLDRQALLDGLEAFHAERMRRIPSPARYPESPPWAAHTLAVDRELKRAAGLTDREMAILRSFHLYITFRGIRRCAPVDEKCRVAYLPETDRGPLSLSNTDDPLTHWQPAPSPTAFPYTGGLGMGGVGNGLHIDEEPDELFPLPALTMLPQYASDVPGGVQFLTRYCPFWGRCNVLLFDAQRRSAAVEKCSFKYIDVFHPGPDGRSHVSGMTCRDPNTPQGKHQTAMREGYLELFKLPADGPDSAFWSACRKFENKLADGLKALGPTPRADDAIRLFTTPWPEGLNKCGLKPHPQSGLVGYTLQTHALLIREKTYLRWQRSQDGKTYPREPEVYQFGG